MKISLVGNGKLSKNYGKTIDKSDLIYRINGAKINGYEKKVGKKTNILSLVGETGLSYINAVYKLDRYILKDIEYIIFSSNKRNIAYEKAILKRKQNGSILFDYIGFDAFMNLVNILHSGFQLSFYPTTGMNTLAYILATNNLLDDGNNEINIYGFDNFKSGYYFDKKVRNNSQFHNLEIESKIIEYLKGFKNIQFFY